MAGNSIKHDVKITINCYKVLGVDPSASEEEIRAAYLESAKSFHPDLNPEDGDAEDRFKDISQAYAILSDPVKRAAFDQQLADKKQQVVVSETEPIASSPGRWAALFLLFLLFGGLAGNVFVDVWHKPTEKPEIQKKTDVPPGKNKSGETIEDGEVDSKAKGRPDLIKSMAAEPVSPSTPLPLRSSAERPQDLGQEQNSRLLSATPPAQPISPSAPSPLEAQVANGGDATISQDRQPVQVIKSENVPKQVAVKPHVEPTTQPNVDTPSSDEIGASETSEEVVVTEHKDKAAPEQNDPAQPSGKVVELPITGPPPWPEPKPNRPTALRQEKDATPEQLVPGDRQPHIGKNDVPAPQQEEKIALATPDSNPTVDDEDVLNQALDVPFSDRDLSLEERNEGARPIPWRLRKKLLELRRLGIKGLPNKFVRHRGQLCLQRRDGSLLCRRWLERLYSLHQRIAYEKNKRQLTSSWPRHPAPYERPRSCQFDDQGDLVCRPYPRR